MAFDTSHELCDIGNEIFQSEPDNSRLVCDICFTSHKSSYLALCSQLTALVFACGSATQPSFELNASHKCSQHRNNKRLTLRAELNKPNFVYSPSAPIAHLYLTADV